MKKKHTGVKVFITLILLAGAGGGGYYWYTNYYEGSSTVNDNPVYVDSISNITGVVSTGVNNQYAGIVEPQETLDVKLDSDKTVKDLLVEEGDHVSKGASLFTYDTTSDQQDLAEGEIELERMQNEIEATNQQITQLENEKAKATDDSQLSYTTQILTAQNTVKRLQYEVQKQNVKLEQLKTDISDSTVYCEMDGIVQTINDSASSGTSNSPMGSSSSDSSAYITILADGNYRIKGTINEQNSSEIVTGASMIVYSRMDTSQTWTGVITTIDYSNPENSSDSGSSTFSNTSGSSSLTTTSSYPFYVDVENADGLMLGQHVYMELDKGQDEAETGIWLEEYYILQDDDGSYYVWAADINDKIEKRVITVGDYNESTMKYEVLSGLAPEDYIAFPEDGITAGRTATKNLLDMTSYTDSQTTTMDGVATPADVYEGEGSSEVSVLDGAGTTDVINGGSTPDGSATVIDDSAVMDGTISDNGPGSSPQNAVVVDDGSGQGSLDGAVVVGEGPGGVSP